MTSTPDRRLRGLAGGLVALLLAVGAQAEDLPADALEARARSALAQGDGVGAQILLERAMRAGRGRDAVTAAMGEAYLAQGDLRRAREWLAPGRFAAGQEAYGLRVLARLERREGNLAAAGRAYDQALRFTPRDSQLWVEIGRLRYAGGEQRQAIEAAEQAVALAPDNPRALEFRAELVRDQFGLAAALPWYERALIKSPRDTDLLAGYAATLGDLGRARDMLAVTGRILELSPGHSRALFLQAALAARGGQIDAARSLLDKAGPDAGRLPGGQLLRAVIELESGNPQTAAQALVPLLEAQPANQPAQMLYARALHAAGQHAALVERLSTVADRPDAPAYLVELVGRSLEALGRRDAAAPWLDRAAAARALPITPLLPFSDPAQIAQAYAANPEDTSAVLGQVRVLLVSGQTGAAQAVTARHLALHPGSARAHALHGDALLAGGQAEAALAQYGYAAAVRLDDSLLLRMAGAQESARGVGASGPLIQTYLARNPGSTVAARLAANGAAAAGRWEEARALLAGLYARGGGRDARLLADLALAELYSGDSAAALASAARAHALQRSSGAAALALGLVLAERGERPALAARLLDKAAALDGANPLILAARRQLAAR